MLVLTLTSRSAVQILATVAEQRIDIYQFPAVSPEDAAEDPILARAAVSSREMAALGLAYVTWYSPRCRLPSVPAKDLSPMPKVNVCVGDSTLGGWQKVRLDMA
jgi:hypothetical protein